MVRAQSNVWKATANSYRVAGTIKPAKPDYDVRQETDVDK